MEVQTPRCSVPGQIGSSQGLQHELRAQDSSLPSGQTDLRPRSNLSSWSCQLMIPTAQRKAGHQAPPSLLHLSFLNQKVPHPWTQPGHPGAAQDLGHKPQFHGALVDGLPPSVPNPPPML